MSITDTSLLQSWPSMPNNTQGVRAGNKTIMPTGGIGLLTFATNALLQLANDLFALSYTGCGHFHSKFLQCVWNLLQYTDIRNKKIKLCLAMCHWCNVNHLNHLHCISKKYVLSYNFARRLQLIKMKNKSSETMVWHRAENDETTHNNENILFCKMWDTEALVTKCNIWHSEDNHVWLLITG